MSKPFKIGLVIGETPGDDPAVVAPGYDFWEVAGALLVEPLTDNRKWTVKRDALLALDHPPITVSCWFTGGGRQGVDNIIAPDPDWDLFEFFVQREFERLAELGVQIVTTGASDWRPVKGMARSKAMDKAFMCFNLLADQAKKYGMIVALEPLAHQDDLWVTYLDGVAFAKEFGRPELKVHGDLAKIVKLSEPLEDLAKYPEYLVHVHIADHGLQPGLVEKWPIPKMLGILKEIGFEGGVSCSCIWVGDFGIETAKTLKYVQNLRDAVYSR